MAQQFRQAVTALSLSTDIVRPKQSGPSDLLGFRQNTMIKDNLSPPMIEPLILVTQQKYNLKNQYDQYRVEPEL